MDLQKGPLGILGWFSLKVRGQNPTLFGDAVVPVVEVGDNYAATSELQIATDSNNLTLTGETTKTFTVPQGKVWRMIGAGGRTALAAADVGLIMQGSINLTSPNISPLRCPIWVGNTLQLGQDVRSFGYAWRPPIFLPSGWKVLVEFEFSAVVTTAVPAFGHVVYQEFDL